MKKQLRNGLMVAALVASFGFYSCGENKDKKEENSEVLTEEMPENETAVSNEMDVEKMENVAFKDAKVQANFEHYIGIKSALVASNNTEAQKHATMLVESLTEAKAAQSLLDATKELVDATDINVQREAFSKVTKEMEPVLTGALASGEIFKQFCPMAFEGKGDYWYSTSSEIRNPYYGDKMLKCGRVDEVIN